MTGRQNHVPTEFWPGQVLYIPAFTRMVGNRRGFYVVIDKAQPASGSPAGWYFVEGRRVHRDGTPSTDRRLGQRCVSVVLDIADVVQVCT